MSHLSAYCHKTEFNPTALRKAKILCNFGLSECNRVNQKTKLKVYTVVTKIITCPSFLLVAGETKTQIIIF